MEVCEHPSCTERRRKWLKGTRNLQIHTEEFNRLIEEGAGLEWSMHLDDRELQRQIPSRQSTDAFVNGECIWFSVVNDPLHGPTNKWVWLGYAKIGKCTYRPLHLVLACPATERVRAVTVMTVYDPTEHDWMWDESFETRICWERNNL